jgi:hypothetical protein
MTVYDLMQENARLATDLKAVKELQLMTEKLCEAFAAQNLELLNKLEKLNTSSVELVTIIDSFVDKTLK